MAHNRPWGTGRALSPLSLCQQSCEEAFCTIREIAFQFPSFLWEGGWCCSLRQKNQTFSLPKGEGGESKRWRGGQVPTKGAHCHQWHIISPDCIQVKDSPGPVEFARYVCVKSTPQILQQKDSAHTGWLRLRIFSWTRSLGRWLKCFDRSWGLWNQREFLKWTGGARNYCVTEAWINNSHSATRCSASQMFPPPDLPEASLPFSLSSHTHHKKLSVQLTHVAMGGKRRNVGRLQAAWGHWPPHVEKDKTLFKGELLLPSVT